MTNTRRLLILVVALATALAFATTATAKKPVGGPPGQEPRAGYTCAEAAELGGLGEFTVATWNGTGILGTYRFSSSDPSLCIDLSNDAGATLTITVTAFENAAGVGGGVKDSHPGDKCAVFDPIYLPAEDLSTSLEIPTATANACGTEWTDDAESLVFFVAPFFSGKFKKDASAFVEVTISSSLP
jgi:hypothetical protein